CARHAAFYNRGFDVW
nr:immunoglobulin heavy chain junction region [Macaca mulatta]MOV49640.1 immunoglobulin heavy chain junction region [Macaca mulatta]MOV50226.1 immunoglobulin heavy chain junction region [Macaca mulatta]MOV52863.1 immunoglobulin heavy chain junction region [Macaca mulatta]